MILRRHYYDLFSHFYDAFVALHSRGDERNTRKFLIDSARMEYIAKPNVLDVCCGTGSVILGFVKRYPESIAAGADFSQGMIRRAKKKDPESKVLFVQGDAARLPFAKDVFDVVVCSHALYELKGLVRSHALEEMKRVVKPAPGSVFIVEHEQPTQPFVKMLFRIRMSLVGSSDAGAFLDDRLAPFREIFPSVHLSRSPSGKSRLLRCIK